MSIELTTGALVTAQGRVFDLSAPVSGAVRGTWIVAHHGPRGPLSLASRLA